MQYEWKCRVNSLWKGNNSKKDVLSSNFNLKETTIIRAVDTWPEENERDEFSPALDYCELVKPSWKKNGKIEPYGATDDNLRNPMAR